MRIAIDAMGGDFAPREIVAGAVDGLVHLGSDDKIVLFGQEEAIRAELSKLQYDASRIEIVHAADVIGMGDHPVEALRAKRDNSIAKMAVAGSSGQVDVMISAGNTGACVAACQMKLRPLDGVSRPGIAVAFPSFGGPLIMCDVGANPEPKAKHMYQYALMSTLFAEQMFDLKRQPKVALLSIGEEESKGTTLTREVRDMLLADPRINFIGNVEGRDLLSGKADVVICDGFTGNIALKIVEGISVGFVKMLLEGLAAENPSLAAASKPILKKLVEKHDYSEYGGAPLLGVDGIFIICHGSSSRLAIGNAVKSAHKLVGSDMNARIRALFNGQG